jgi:transposase
VTAELAYGVTPWLEQGLYAVMRKLVLSFRTILRVGKLATLHGWMERALKTGIHALQRFVRTLKQDMGAVEAAVTERWSNGPVEGHVNRLKTIKRQMYGRAGVELLRARLLPESEREFEKAHDAASRRVIRRIMAT